MSKLAKFIERLYNNTLEGKVRWDETSQEDVFQLSFPDYTLKIYDDRDSTGNTLYILQILNEEGKVIEDISDEDIQDQLTNAFSTMQSLFERARSQAMGLDKALDDIMSYLPTDDGNGTSSDDVPF